MKTAGKLLSRILIVIVVLIVLAAIVLFVAGNSLVRMGIVKGASSALKVPVGLDSVHVHPIFGKVELAGLAVGNPPGYEIPTLLKLGEGKVEVKIGSLMSDTVDIDYIILNKVDVSIEQKGLSTNLNDIIKSLPKGPEQPSGQPAAPGKKLRIKTLEITDINVTAKLLPIPGKTNEVTFKLAPIKMTDLGSDNKLDVAALTSKILAAIAEGVAQQGADLLPSDVTGPIKSGLGSVGEMGKGVLEQGQKAGKGLFGIFKKDANSK
jgi:hypothetical protein